MVMGIGLCPPKGLARRDTAVVQGVAPPCNASSSSWLRMSANWSRCGASSNSKCRTLHPSPLHLPRGYFCAT
eukprot:4125774-Amphidinium_carterae.1